MMAIRYWLICVKTWFLCSTLARRNRSRITKQSFTDYGFLVAPGAYEVILNTDNIAFGGNGFADDSVVHFTIADPLYKKEKKEWLKLYIPARSAVVLRKVKVKK